MCSSDLPILARNCLRAARDLWFVAAADQRQALQTATVAIGTAELFAADVRNQARELQQWMEQKPK